MKTLTIRLAAPLQSYGDEATFARRTSSDHPSKSAVIGMLAAALGYRRDDPRITALNDLAFSLRVDQPGRMMTEFQTVEWKAGTRKLSYRDLLQDAVFVAAVGSDDADLIDQLAQALRHPRFQLFLGRRANPIAGVVQYDVFDNKDPVSVLKALPWRAAEWYQKKRKAQATIDASVYADAELLPDEPTPARVVKDQVVSFDQRDRRFSFRTAKSTQIQLDNPAYDTAQTDHDVWASL